MLRFFDKLKYRDKIIEFNFDCYPFQFFSEGKKINLFIESFLQDLKKNDPQNVENNNLKGEERTVIFTYENKEYEIFKNPINFKMFYENGIIFKAYSKSQLEVILIRLSQYYYFYINSKIENNLKNIISKDNIKEIILCPFLTKLFFKLNFTIDLNNKDMNKIIIQKELLEPLQLYIEKEEITNKIGNNSYFNEKLLVPELIFIFNQERKEFIAKLDEYAKRPYMIEPMKIVGNDGVGKSVTLQFYSLIKLEGYSKFYFNLKLFEKYGIKNYFYIELIRGFLSKEKDKTNNDFKNYINCIKYMQTLKDLDANGFLNVLKELINYLNLNEKKFIIILDQFKYEYISDKDFEIFKNQIDKEKFKLIICCSLNDGEIKNKMFKEYEKNVSWMFDYSIDEEEEENISQEEDNELNEIKIENDNNFNLSEENKLNLKNIFILKKRRRTEVELYNEDISNKKKKEEPFQPETSNKDKDVKIVSDRKIIGDELMKNEKSSNSNNKENNEKSEDLLFKPKCVCDSPIIFPDDESNEIILYDTSPVQLYYNNLIDLKDIIKKNEPVEIYDFMSNFNFLPKYYYKFNIFRLNQKFKNIKDNITIIENFKQEINNKIKENIKKFYSKDSKIDFIFSNIYNYILELKGKTNKYNDKTISFIQLYKFSKKFPMKYIIVEPQDKTNNIRFDDKLTDKKFRINYSFPFIEYALNDIIEEYDFSNKIDIEDLSGSAFGNALELKLRKYIKKLNEKIEIRKVWALNLVSESVKKNKLKEIENKTLNSARYEDLEDIYKIKPLKDSNCFYFHPENQDNYLLDSIIIINHGNNNFSIIAFQITKHKSKDEIKSKKTFKDYILKNVKTKFSDLYNINITDIYLWFILSNDHIDNNDTCIYLNFQKIKYVFYSIEKNCLFEERNKNKIDNLLFFEKKEALIYSKNGDYYDDEDENNIKIEPLSISKFEDKLYNLSEKYETINYENVRKFYFRNNYGLIIGNKLRNSIIEIIKSINGNNNNFYFLFLFSFPFFDFSKYYNLEDDLIFILKYENIIYLSYKDYYYEIDLKNNKLKPSKNIKIDLKEFTKFQNAINYNEEEIDISKIKDLRESSIIYLYKIYLLEEIKDK